MNIQGLQKTTLLDFPGHVAATIFTGGCNFRCPFCHNSDLLSFSKPSAFMEEDILHFLKKRVGILEGVVITGGEPTLQPNLPAFMERVRQLGYKIKLDTNGYQPDVLKSLYNNGLIDYVAMDIKTCKERYTLVTGIPSIEIKKIETSVNFLKTSTIPFEFRTTVVRELHCAEDFEKIGDWIEGAPLYFLQNFVDSEQVLNHSFSSFSKEELLSFLEIVKPYVGKAEIRGIEY